MELSIAIAWQANPEFTRKMGSCAHKLRNQTIEPLFSVLAGNYMWFMGLRHLVQVRLSEHEKLDILLTADGKVGYSQAADISPDIVILDWMLPDIAGLEILK